MTRIAIIGGGPGGYEAALVASSLGAQVVLADKDGLGGACVLSDCVPSKALIAAPVRLSPAHARPEDFWPMNQRVKALAAAQSADIEASLRQAKVTLLKGAARFVDPRRIVVTPPEGPPVEVVADVVLIATGAHPRLISGSKPDGEVILTWRQLYELKSLPEKLIVVGSGVTGAELANAYQMLDSHVTLVSSRDRVLPGEDADAAQVLEEVFRKRGMTVINRARAASVERTATGARVTLEDGRSLEGSHCLIAVGSVPNTADLGLDLVGVKTSASGHIEVDRVSRTTAPGIYAAGDCTGVLMLASVAAMQGRIAMYHALGEAVTPLRLSTVAANVFTDPEIATIGISQRDVESGKENARVVKLPLSKNARAKMEGITDGFVKLFCTPGTGTVVGGVVVAPRASELIVSLSLAVRLGLTVEQLSNTFTIYPSLTGSLTEAARQLMERAR